MRASNDPEEVMKTDTHIPGFDYARAIFSIFVVIWHCHAIAQPSLWSATDVARYYPSLLDLINYYVLLEAVPFFITMGVYLYVLQGGAWDRLWKRCAHLLSLAIFWGVANLVFNVGGRAIHDLAMALEASPMYTIAQAGGTIFYFFIALTITTAWAEIVRRLPTSAVVVALFASCGAMIFFGWLANSGIYGLALAFWSPFDYLPYPPAIILFVRYQKFIMRYAVWASATFFALCVVTSIFEWQTLVIRSIDSVRPDGFGFPEYARLSAFWLSMALLPLFLMIKKRAPRPIVYASNASLSLYCLQLFMLALIPAFINVSSKPPLFLAVLTIFCCYISAEILKRYVLSPKLLGYSLFSASGRSTKMAPASLDRMHGQTAQPFDRS